MTTDIPKDRRRISTAVAVAVVAVLGGIIWSFLLGAALPWLPICVGLGLAWAALYYLLDLHRHWPTLVVGQWLSVALVIQLAASDLEVWWASLYFAAILMAFWMIPVAIFRVATRHMARAT